MIGEADILVIFQSYLSSITSSAFLSTSKERHSNAYFTARFDPIFLGQRNQLMSLQSAQSSRTTNTISAAILPSPSHQAITYLQSISSDMVRPIPDMLT